VIPLTASLVESGLSVGAGLIGMGAAAWRTARKRRARPNTTIHGDARFMDWKELKKTGLLNNKGGVYLGSWRDKRGVAHYLRDNSDRHVIIFAPTRSGKSVGPLAMTLLSWPESVVINDIKGELWELSAQWRHWHAGNRIYRWEPAALHGSSAFNFLDEVRLDTPHDVADAQNIAQGWIDHRGLGSDELDHWRKISLSLLAGCILHVLYRERAKKRSASLADVATALSGAEGLPNALWEEMRDNRHLQGQPHPLVTAEGNGQIGRSDRERSSVWSTIKSFLAVFSDPILAQNISRSDFKLSDIADAQRPISIYIVTAGTDSERLRSVTRLFVTMVRHHLMSAPLVFENNRQLPAHKYSTLMAIDELPDLGRIEVIEGLLAKGAGYRIKCLLSCQALEQLADTYGANNSIVGNCHIRIACTPNDLPTAEWISKMCGRHTVWTENIMESGSRIGWVKTSIEPIRQYQGICCRRMRC
jgi:type IV secretion system protein VirD4